MNFSASSLTELKEIAPRILNELDREVVLFTGEMGAGKTTLIKELLAALGSKDAVSSPTFSLVNEYLLPKGDTCYHFDFYRLNDEVEALDFGVEEYFASGRYCFCEWPERIPSLLPEQYVLVEIEESDSVRNIRVEKIG
jgi:tRNA threonylcarbamoyladenosine biosynthesis protein TsaE